MRAFKKNAGFLAGGGCAQLAFTASALGRQKSAVVKGIRRETGADQGGDEGGGAGQHSVRKSFGNACREDARAGIGNSRHPGVGDHRDGFPSTKPFKQFQRASRLVVFVV